MYMHDNIYISWLYINVDNKVDITPVVVQSSILKNLLVVYFETSNYVVWLTYSIISIMVIIILEKMF